MNATQATTFEKGKSKDHEIFLSMVAASRGCACQAYQDWFTFRRWQAQGMQVQRGEKGTKLTTYIPVFVTDDSGDKHPSGTRPKTTSVFCHCQVKAK
jgi:antirestriction protein ArdC